MSIRGNLWDWWSVWNRGIMQTVIHWIFLHSDKKFYNNLIFHDDSQRLDERPLNIHTRMSQVNVASL